MVVFMVVSCLVFSLEALAAELVEASLLQQPLTSKVKAAMMSVIFFILL